MTIGRAARLFDFTENQLRDWEKHGLLKPQRSKGSSGQRQYSLRELDMLAIIKELIEKGGYTPGTVPQDIDKIWDSVSVEPRDKIARIDKEAKHLHIEQRAENVYEGFFWPYYASHALHLSLMLICEDASDSNAGLLLPFVKKIFTPAPSSEDLSAVGESLIGWLGQTRSFYTFLTSAPSFEYPSDYHILSLKAKEESVPKDGTLLIIERHDVKRLNLNIAIVETIRRLLSPIYEEAQSLKSCFGPGMRDVLDPAPNFGSSAIYADIILNGLADMIVRLGGRTDDGHQRWRFCCIMLPEAPLLPLQQRSLVVQAQSKNSPHKLGMTTIFPGKYVNSLGLRAFQSGHIIYREDVSPADATIALREMEGPIHSAIAVPVGGENGQPVAVLYIVSDEVSAFSKSDQRVLRIIGRIAEELIRTYSARQQATEKLGDLIMTPALVDSLFADFLSEKEFVSDVEELLASISKNMRYKEELISRYSGSVTDHDIQKKAESSEEIVSFIALDIDDQSSLANRYGNRVMRNLSRTIGVRVQEMVKALFTKHADCKLYHIYAGRFYLLLKGISLEYARAKAETIRQALEGHIFTEQMTTSARALVLPDTTIRLGVTSYQFAKLEENLMSDNYVNVVTEVRAKIALALDLALNIGKDEGGNVVIAWNTETRGFLRWSP